MCFTKQVAIKQWEGWKCFVCPASFACFACCLGRTFHNVSFLSEPLYLCTTMPDKQVCTTTDPCFSSFQTLQREKDSPTPETFQMLRPPKVSFLFIFIHFSLCNYVRYAVLSGSKVSLRVTFALIGKMLVLMGSLSVRMCAVGFWSSVA